MFKYNYYENISLKKTESKVSKRNLYTHDHSSVIHCGEATQVSVDGRMNKQNVVLTYNGILAIL